MIVWFPSGWEEYAKWSEAEEAAIASLIAGKVRPLRQALNHVKKEKAGEREVNLGVGPGNRHYYIEISYVDDIENNPDFMQMLRQAPLSAISAELLAGALPDESFKGRIRVGWIYDDGDETSLKIIGLAETSRLSNLILANL